MINLIKTIYKIDGFKEPELKFSSAIYYLYDFGHINEPL